MRKRDRRTHKERGNYPTGACFQRDCRNVNIKCDICFRLKGKYTEYRGRYELLNEDQENDT